ncbi:hypothetical protein PGT21_014637 [Puccinia graminis f. sp. tritici]|uniref:NADH dehydrogenase (Ubiquinone) 1 beta subcomplex 8 n=1 Tax=Puccinia graminis f. sp. tritici TaxID=56615 RepID=A0A5B0M3F9_PUCGR|nr:hypothetical protein PGT21_014637 [Puccinia graminis f. sp. tritici]KAA1089889.1 hypothetical protein PGTUg99_026982 [Puccinia graminis f. sp. tritici]KAA1129310.1 hypothetical protein PGTUg99_026183 [Puccinia graminis f. sp. tritici]
MAHLPLSRALRTSKNLLNSNISRRAYASASPQLISPTNEISVPPQRTAYEYKPLDEPDPQLDGLGYPRVESLSRQWRNPYAKWDDPQERCNFNEPLHAEEEMMGIWAPDVHRISVPSALINLAVAFTGLGVILVSAAYMAPSSPVVPRTFPFDGLTRELGGPGQGVKTASSSEESD